MPEKKSAIEFEDPPQGPPSYDWQAIARQLKRRPMRWAKVFEKDRASVVVAIKAGHIAAVHPDLGYEARTTDNDKTSTPRTCTLYMRFNPEKADNLKGAVRRGREGKK